MTADETIRNIIKNAAEYEASVDHQYGEEGPTRAVITGRLTREPTDEEWTAYRREYARAAQALAEVPLLSPREALRALLDATAPIADLLRATDDTASNDAAASLLGARTAALVSLELYEESAA